MADFIGGFLSGFIGQRNIERDFALREKGLEGGLALREQELQSQNRRDAATKRKQFREELTTVMQKTLAAVRENRRVGNETGVQRLREVFSRTVDMAQGRGVDVGNIKERFDAQTESFQTAEQEAGLTARSNVTGAQATATALSNAGVSTSTAETAQAAGLTPASKAANVITFRMPDGSTQSVDANDNGAVSQIIAAGGTRVSLGVQATDLAGLGSPAKGERQDAAEASRLASAELADISTTLGEFERIGGGASGLRGLAVERIGGLLGQISKTAEEGFAESLGGASSGEIQALRTRARTVVAKMISEITAEETGRISEGERALANEALRLLEPGASETQIRAALGIAVQIKVLQRDRNRFGSGVKPKFDLSTPEGRQLQGDELVNVFNLSVEEAVDTLRRMILQRSLLQETIEVEGG